MNNIYLKSYIRCKRKAWLDFNGKKSSKIWSPYKAIEKIHQYEVFNKFSKGDLYSGSKACERGFTGVIGVKIHLQENVVERKQKQSGFQKNC